MQEWYLMQNNNRPHELGGFENDSFNDHKYDSFEETLETDFARTVKLYRKHDLSEYKTIRCIIQDNVSNTTLNSMDRCVLATVGTLRAGDYLFFEDRYWLVTGYPGNNNGMYEKAVIALCQYCIRWQDNNLNIHDRWVNLATASKYGTGEYNDRTIILTENNMTMLIPYDEYTLDLDEKRFFLDTHKIPTKVYRTNRNDDPLYDYGTHGAILSFVLDKVEFDKDKDNQELRICDYIDPVNNRKEELIVKDNVLHYEAIVDGNRELKFGSYRTYTITFSLKGTEKYIEPSSVDYTCEVNIPDGSPLKETDLSLELNKPIGKFKIKCSKDWNLVGENFFVNVYAYGELIGKVSITIVDIA